MMINPIGFGYGSFGMSGASSVTTGGEEILGTAGVGGAQGVGEAQGVLGKVDKPDARHGGECQTCKNRKYQDGSDEMVSFKSASHIAPEAAAARVRGHEGEHVSNAYKKAFQEGGKVINASVSLHTAVCPECGKTYVSGGVTNTVISTPKEGTDNKNPYNQNKMAVSQANSPGLVFNAKG